MSFNFEELLKDYINELFLVQGSLGVATLKGRKATKIERQQYNNFLL